MANTIVQTPLGPGRTFINKGSLSNVGLEARQVDGLTYRNAIIALHGLDGADDPARFDEIIAQVCANFAPFLDRLEDYHRQAMAALQTLGLPPDIEITNARLQQSATFPDRFSQQQIDAEAATLGYYIAPHHFTFRIAKDGALNPHFVDSGAPNSLKDIIAAHNRAKAAPLKHKVFGDFKPDTLVDLKRKKLGGKFVSFDLYLADPDLGKIKATDLDQFVPLRENLDALAPQLVPHLLELRHDWASNWLDPLNADVARAFHKAFPEAEPSGAISADTFQNALWLSRVNLQPFAKNGPTATWDFHALSKDRDNTIFVIRTTPNGEVTDVTTES